MESRRQRLGKLVALQRRVKAVHETRNARHRQAAIAAEADAEAIASRFDAEDSLSSLFPDLYHSHTVRARERQAEELAKAAEHATMANRAGVRADIVRRAYIEAASEEERARAEREMLEFIERMAGGGK
jgi:hypothetical protein